MFSQQTVLCDGTTQSVDLALKFTSLSTEALLLLCETNTGALDQTIGAAVVEVEPMDVEPALAEELAAWQAAGDEAFYSTEKLLE